MRNRFSINAAGVLFLVLFSAKAWGALNPYGAYGLYSRGSGRTMAMGGVYAAISDDATSAVENPAGPALAKWNFDAGAATDRISNSEAPAQGQNNLYNYANNQPFSYLSYGAAGRIGPVVIGLGYSTPYEFAYDNSSLFSSFNSSKAQITLASFDGMLALAVNDSIAIGVAGHFMTATEKFEENGTTGEVQAGATSVSVGVAYRTKKGGFGLVHSPGILIGMDASKNATFPTHSWFRDIVVPSTTTFGAFYRVTDRFRMGADVYKFEVPFNTVDALSGLSTNSDVAVQAGTTQVLHGGVEWVLVSDKNIELIFRGGAYQEPARIINGESRFHRTFGLQMRFGFAMLNVSFDQASNFNSTSQGFSIILGAI